jgi:hypothetical protein
MSRVDDTTVCQLTAYAVGPTEGWSITPASPRREWMDKLHGGFAYRCLPLVMANQLGWVVRGPIGAEAVWSGGADASHLAVTPLESTPEPQRAMIGSHFGGGIVTVSLPWLFRTPPGVALWVGGVPNRPTPGAFPLEGVIETAWSPYTFTMNFKLTDAGRSVFFDPGEPLCVIRPVSFGSLESVRVRHAPIEEAPDLKRDFERWRGLRLAFNADPDRTPKDWQKNYNRGRSPDGQDAAGGEHRTKLSLHKPERG